MTRPARTDASRRDGTRTYVLEDDDSASLLELVVDGHGITGRLLETTFTGGMAFEVSALVGGYVRDDVLQLLFTSEGAERGFVIESHGSLDDDAVILARSGGFGTVRYARASEEAYRLAVARIVARHVRAGSTT